METNKDLSSSDFDMFQFAKQKLIMDKDGTNMPVPVFTCIKP